MSGSKKDGLVLRTPTTGQKSQIYAGQPTYELADQPSRFTAFCMWADANGFNPVEYLLPAIEVDTQIGPYAFEQRGEHFPPPSTAELDQHKPWHYKIDFANGVTTRDFKIKEEWLYHHHRAATLVELAHRLYGDDRAKASVLDIGCHCGIFSLEFASRGFGAVRGVDLRRENVEQAEFLAKHFQLPNASFAQLNARDIRGEAPADIVFCGGLLYHLTFPYEFMQNLAAITQDVLIFDTLCSRHPFSGFHYINGKDVSLSIEGETAVEFVPTYRAVIDLLQAAGFTDIYEILSANRHGVPFYENGDTRSFIASRHGRLRTFVNGLRRI